MPPKKSLCKGKSVKSPNTCKKLRGCKVAKGSKRTYCRKKYNRPRSTRKRRSSESYSQKRRRVSKERKKLKINMRKPGQSTWNFRKEQDRNRRREARRRAREQEERSWGPAEPRLHLHRNPLLGREGLPTPKFAQFVSDRM